LRSKTTPPRPYGQKYGPKRVQQTGGRFARHIHCSVIEECAFLYDGLVGRKVRHVRPKRSRLAVPHARRSKLASVNALLGRVALEYGFISAPPFESLKLSGETIQRCWLETNTNRCLLPFRSHQRILGLQNCPNTAVARTVYGLKSQSTSSNARASKNEIYGTGYARWKIAKDLRKLSTLGLVAPHPGAPIEIGALRGELIARLIRVSETARNREAVSHAI
jgi:hypothetical protein